MIIGLTDKRCMQIMLELRPRIVGMDVDGSGARDGHVIGDDSAGCLAQEGALHHGRGITAGMIISSDSAHAAVVIIPGIDFGHLTGERSRWG